MNNKTRPMKAIDFQNKMEGKLVKHEELLMSARDRMLKTENDLRALRESIELVEDDVSEDTGKVPWCEVILFIAAAVVIMVVHNVLG